MTPVYPARAYPSHTCHVPPGMRAIYLTERLGAAFALLILSPVFATLAIMIAILSRRSPLVRHARAGWRGAPLGLLKFRTMWCDRDLSGPLFVIDDVGGCVPESKPECDCRVSSGFAAYCRRYSLDELPQLYHVVRGDMSMVGPRPITREELQQHYTECTDEVLSLRPGLTGLWQISGRNRLSYAQRKRLDLLFVRRVSAGLYLRIILLSIPRVLSGDGAR